MNKISGVEVFSVGEWNGDEYTLDDLNEMVKAFNETHKGARPYLKLGHDDSQKLIQSDGLPAAGWVENLYVSGSKLLADFSDIPTKIYELILKKAYRKVSCEIFWNIKVGEQMYRRMVGAIALLGANTPGVMNLNDIMAQYKKYTGTYDKLIIDNISEFKLGSKETEAKGDNMEKTEKEIKLEFSLNEKEQELKKTNEALDVIKKASEAAEKELADLKKFKAEAEAREIENAKKLEEARIEKFVADLKAEKLCTPAMEPIVKEILGPVKKDYSVGDKKVSKEEALKEVLKLYQSAKDVNFEENSSNDAAKKASTEQEIDKLAQEYADKNKVSYSVALKEILKNKKG